MLKQVQFQGIKSLLHVTLDLAPFTVLVGPNGCGKSTMLDQIEVLGIASRTRKPGGPLLGPVGEVLARMGPRSSRTRSSTGEMKWRGRDEGGNELTVSVEGGEGGTGMESVALRAVTAGKRNAKIAQGQQNESVWNDTVAAQFRWEAQRLALVPHRAAAPSEVYLTGLRPDGYGLPTVLKDFASDHTKLYLAMQQDLTTVVPHFRELRFGKASNSSAEGAAHAHLLEFEMSQGRVRAEEVSDGTLLALALLTVVHNPDLPKIVLIDDIDHGLHLGAQFELVKAIRAVQTVRPELQVICTTHSPVLLDSFDVSEVRVLTLDAAGHTWAASLSAHPELARYQRVLETGEFWASMGEDWVLNVPRSG